MGALAQSKLTIPLKSREQIFFSKKFTLAIADGPHRPCYTQKLASSGGLETEWASQFVRTAFVEARGSQLLEGHAVRRLSRLPNDMTGSVLRNISIIAVIQSLVLYKRTLGSSYDPVLDEARTNNICKELVSCEFLPGGCEATYRRYVWMTRLVRRYQDAVRLVETVSDKAVARDSAAKKDELGITYLNRDLLFESEKKDALLLIADAGARTKKNTEGKRTAALLTPQAFYSVADALPAKLRTVRKKADLSSKSTLESFGQLKSNGQRSLH